jgi:glycosyltransferase involved in cell wall biosynthesis
MSDTTKNHSMKRALLISTDVIGPDMAGPGIRVWELARALSTVCDVTVAAPRVPDTSPPEFRLISYPIRQAGALSPALAQADLVMGQGLVFTAHPEVLASGLPLAIDLYDPELLESLHFENGQSYELIAAEHQRYVHQMMVMLRKGDFFFCATERQRDYWIGALSAFGRINVPNYSRDLSLRSLIDLVPSGIPSEPPSATRPVLRGVHPAIGPDARLFLWAGGLWHWFEPQLLVRAAAALQDELPQLRICFFAGARPNPYGEPYRTPTGERAYQLAAELGVLNRSVIFLEDWVPYAERGAYLAEADVGVSSHLDGVETRFAFRTRLLDYIWARLPVLSSAGDSLGTEIAEAGAGELVPIGDLDGWITAIRRMYHDDGHRAACRAAAEKLASKYTWERVAQPLINFCRTAQHTPDGDLMRDLIASQTPDPDAALRQQLHEQAQHIAKLTAEIERKNQHISELEALLERIQNGRVMRLLRRLHG